jgi:hypothetical protein
MRQQASKRDIQKKVGTFLYASYHHTEHNISHINMFSCYCTTLYTNVPRFLFTFIASFWEEGVRCLVDYAIAEDFSKEIESLKATSCLAWFHFCVFYAAMFTTFRDLRLY